MINIDRVAEKIFKILKGHGYSVRLYADDGMDTIDPELARRFYVDDPNMLITLDQEGEEIVMNKSQEVPLHVYEAVLQRVKRLSNEYMLNFTLREFGKKVEPKNFSYQAKKVKENSMNSISEGSLSKMFGSRKTSRQTLEHVQIVVKHKKDVNEESRGSRTRNIHSIFLESGGERFRFPHNNLSGARAMARHMSGGGTVNDMIGEHIVESTGDLLRLKEFMRYVKSNKLINESSEDVVEVVRENINALQIDLKKLTGTNSYNIAASRLQEQSENELIENNDTSNFKEMFTVRRFDEKYDDVLPLVSKLVQVNENHLKKIEESSEGTVWISPQVKESVLSILEYESKSAEIGNKIKEMSNRVLENSELASYLGKIGNKLISERELSIFETSILSNVLSNTQVQQIHETEETMVTESIRTYEDTFNKYDHIFMNEDK